MRVSTITAIGDFDALSPASTDWLRLVASRCSGTEDAPLRTTVNPIPGDDGVYIEPPLDDAQIMTFGGDVRITDATDADDYWDRVDALIADLKAALDAMKAAPADLVHGGGTLSCWKYAPLESDVSDTIKSVTFGLIVDVT